MILPKPPSNPPIMLVASINKIVFLKGKTLAILSTKMKSLFTELIVVRANHNKNIAIKPAKNELIALSPKAKEIINATSTNNHQIGK